MANTVLVTLCHFFLDVLFNTVRLTNTVRCLAPADRVITRLRCILNCIGSQNLNLSTFSVEHEKRFYNLRARVFMVTMLMVNMGLVLPGHGKAVLLVVACRQ